MVATPSRHRDDAALVEVVSSSWVASHSRNAASVIESEPTAFAMARFYASFAELTTTRLRPASLAR